MEIAELLVRSRELLDSALEQLGGTGDQAARVTPQQDWGTTLEQRLREVREGVVLAISDPIHARSEYSGAEKLISGLIEGGKQVQVLMSARYVDDYGLESLLNNRALGDRIRVAEAEFHNTMVIDRRVAVLWTRVEGLPRAYFASDYTLMGAIYQFVTQTWATALPLRDYVALRRREFDSLAVEVLRLLNDGLTDEVAARRLSVSTRTYRRCIADLMVRLNVSTRFQLGSRAAELGLLKDPPSAR